jgi:hypothetical protein
VPGIHCKFDFALDRWSEIDTLRISIQEHGAVHHNCSGFFQFDGGGSPQFFFVAKKGIGAGPFLFVWRGNRQTMILRDLSANGSFEQPRIIKGNHIPFLLQNNACLAHSLLFFF